MTLGEAPILFAEDHVRPLPRPDTGDVAGGDVIRPGRAGSADRQELSSPNRAPPSNLRHETGVSVKKHTFFHAFAGADR
jgi:hypothetical protein